MFLKLNLIFYLLFFAIQCIYCQNIALHKPYTLSNTPNYTYTALPTDKTALTDGIYTTGYFWSQRTTVGWHREPVVITIDLGHAEPISAVTFNTVRREDQNVFYPKNIFIYLSNDDQNYQYVGDAADTSDNIPGPYLIKKFVLNNINKMGRYVRLSVIPNATLLFCDEIEVIKGNNVTPVLASSLIPKTELQQADDSLKKIEFIQQNLTREVDRLRKIPNSNPVGRQIQQQLKRKNLSEKDLNNLHEKLGIQYALQLRKTSKSSYSVHPFNPWDTLNRFYIPSSTSSSLQYEFYIPENGVQYGSFIITNNSTTTRSFNFKINNISSFTTLDLFDVPFVPSINYKEVPDPLLKIKGDITVGAGNTEMIIFELSGLKPGSSRINIIINSGGIKKTAFINSQVFKIPENITSQPLNANVWAYFSRAMISDRREQAATDLYEHHVNTIVIPYSVLPMISTTDYSGLKNYLANLKEVKYFLLLMGYSSPFFRNGYPNGQFLSSEWKAKFIEWYNKISTYIRQNGFPNSQIYLYPFDEVYGKDIQTFKDLIVWAKEAIPGIKFYATLADDEAINTLLPLVDIVQIQSNYKRLNNLPGHNCDIWIYSGSGPSRALSPYCFYRLMSWEAFANGYKGIGFWNYADEGLNKKFNLIADPLISPTSSYSVIYDGPGTQIISTRRWEAFRLGIEDYSILQAYAQKFGINKAKALANEVISIPADVNKADTARNLMINSVLGIDDFKKSK